MGASASREKFRESVSSLVEVDVSPDDAEFWSDVTMQYTTTHERKSLVELVRCERCAVGIHPACAVDYSEWSGKLGEPGGYYDNRDILRGALLCCKCFDDHLPYVWADDPDHNPDTDIRETRELSLIHI